MRKTIAAAGAAAAMTVAAWGASAPAAKIDAIRMQLFYASSGTLSEDVSKTPEGWWNTIIGEGAAKEPADDMLVSVVLKSASDEANLDAPVTLTARGDKNKVLGKRVFQAVFLKNHSAVLPLLLTNVGCAGWVTVEATFAGQKKTAKVNMACGE